LLADEDAIGSAQAARRLGVSKNTMAVWRARGVGPPCHYAGDKPIYYPSELRAWIDECTARKLREREEQVIRAAEGGKRKRGRPRGIGLAGRCSVPLTVSEHKA
jgi:hypothetical protein